MRVSKKRESKRIKDRVVKQKVLKRERKREQNRIKGYQNKRQFKSKFREINIVNKYFNRIK